MKVEMVLVLAAIAFALADARPMNMTKPKLNNIFRKTFIPITIEERRKLSLFPKSSMKFIVTERPYANQDERPQRLGKNSVVQKMESIQTTTEVTHELKATRAPLIKLRKFSLSIQAPIEITTNSNSKRKPIVKYAKLEEEEISKEDTISTEIREDKPTEHSRYTIRRPPSKPYVNSRRYDDVKSNKPDEEMKNDDTSSEEFDAESSHIDIKVIKTDDERKLKNKRKIDGKENKEHTNEDTTESFKDRNEVSETNAKEVVAENNLEDIVIEEYLAVRDKMNQAGPGELLSDVEDDTTEYAEVMDQAESRSKRNVVEEENITSTVSGYKFTGKDTNLHSHISYKNINS